jgi:thymidylate synthase
LFTHLIANEIEADVGELIMTFGDVHIYQNHIDAVNEQLTREPFQFPGLNTACVDSIFTATVDDITLVNYECHPAIKAEMAV